MTLFKLVNIYLGLALSFPPLFLVPNCPKGINKLILLEPTKFWAIATIVPDRDCSPWWYAECSLIYPTNWATFISSLRFLLKHPNNIFLSEGFNPSHILGIERWLSYIENKIKSLLMNFSYVILSTLRSRGGVLGSKFNIQFFLSSAFFLLKAISILSSSKLLVYSKSIRCLCISEKYSCASLFEDVPRPL